jgi:hypothetical protein
LRLRIGASILSAARAVDTRFVKERLARFEREHQRYAGAQRNVAAIERQLRAARFRLSGCDAVQDDAVEALARALVADGQRRRNPFAAFGALSPSKLSRLPFADEAKAVHRLVTAIRCSKPISKETSKAAQRADKAARAVERAMIPVQNLQASIRDARRMRDAIARGWESAFAGLRRGARAAADDGAPQLHAKLFPPASRTMKGKASATSGRLPSSLRRPFRKPRSGVVA